MLMGTCRFTTKDWLKITTAAMRARMSRSEFIRRAVLAALDERQHNTTRQKVECIDG